MSEMTKTSAFVGAGAVALLAAFAVGTSEPALDVESLVGSRINQFDVEAPTRLRVVKFDAEDGAVNDFEVAKRDNLWTIPSKQGYPADAAEHMGDAASCVANLEVLRVQSQTPQDHAELGVVDPLASGLDSKSKGVGTRVVMTDAKDESLVDMIIGAKVKGADDQYYVRNSNQDVAYVVKLDPSKLTTSFEDWIEDDLLGLNTFDMRQLYVNDYSAELAMVLTPQGFRTQVSWDPRGEYQFLYDSTDSKWKTGELKAFDRQTGEATPFQLDESQEINEDTLRELRNALDDLLIVDVEKKPAGLSGDLKTGEDFLNKENEQAINSLQERGFAAAQRSADGPLEILSSEGETICTLRNGVEYVLRFGKLKVAAAEGEAKEAAEPDAQPDQTDLPESQLNRYLFVMARFNEDVIDKPKIEDLPELPPDAQDKSETESSDPAGEESAEKPEGSDDATPPAGDAAAVLSPSLQLAALTTDAISVEEEEEEQEEQPATSDADVEAEEAAEEAASDESNAERQAEEQTQATEATDEAVQEPDAQQTDAQQADAQQADAESADAESADADGESETPGDEIATGDAEDQPPAEQPEPESLESLIARRKSIEAENNRKLEEYQKTIEEGRKRVDELNLRFGDWYYVISDKVYKQIHVGRAELFKDKKQDDKTGDGAAADAPPAELQGLPDLPIGP